MTYGVSQPVVIIDSFVFKSCFTSTLRVDPSQINVILQQKLPAAKLSTVCTEKKWLCLYCYLAGCNCGFKNRCKNTGYYFIFHLKLLLLLNNYQYNCNNTIRLWVYASADCAKQITKTNNITYNVRFNLFPYIYFTKHIHS